MSLQFNDNHYTIRQNIFSALGATVKVLNTEGKMVLYCRQKALKLKEDIRIYSDETKSQEIFKIMARNIIDFSAIYDIFDSQNSDQVIGSLQRKGMKSILKDEWSVLNTAGAEIATIKEESTFLAIFRRTLGGLIPQTYVISAGEKKIGKIYRNFNPFVNKVNVEFQPESSQYFDHAVGLSAALLLVIIEGKQR